MSAADPPPAGTRTIPTTMPCPTASTASAVTQAAAAAPTRANTTPFRCPVGSGYKGVDKTLILPTADRQTGERRTPPTHPSGAPPTTTHHQPGPPLQCAQEAIMPATGSSALYTALAYHRAWSSHDLDRAMGYIAPDIVCHAPAGPIIGADAFRDYIGPISKNLTRSELIAAFGDTHTAVLIYDTDTVPVHHAPAAEHHTIKDGQIIRLQIIFDRAPFEAARRAAG